MPRLTAVVPATNAPLTLERCLQAIRAAVDPPEELVVVEQPRGIGPAAARNRGVREATGDILVFVDADVVVHPDAFSHIRAVFAADPALIGVFGSYDDRPEAAGSVSVFRNLLHRHVHQESPGPAETFWAGLGALRHDAFLAAGGFDARRYARPSIEDVELGLRLSEAGARIELDPRIQGTHLKAWSLADMLVTDFARRGVPWVELLLRLERVPTSLNLGWRHRASALACLIVLSGLVARRPGVAASGGAAFVSLNLPFYRLLSRRCGPGVAATGIGLHALHHLAGIAAVPAGALVYVARDRSGRDTRRGSGPAGSEPH